MEGDLESLEELNLGVHDLAAGLGWKGILAVPLGMWCLPKIRKTLDYPLTMTWASSLEGDRQGQERCDQGGEVGHLCNLPPRAESGMDESGRGGGSSNDEEEGGYCRHKGSCPQLVTLNLPCSALSTHSGWLSTFGLALRSMACPDFWTGGIDDEACSAIYI